jgi:aspartate carbamoyltransferase catalytic subunit
MKNLIDISDISLEEEQELIGLARDIQTNPEKYKEACRGKKLATLFFEPSTRTRLSFEAAMIELGGSVIGFSSSDCSSVAKGESVSDTVRTVACYADIIALRHSKEGAALVAARQVDIPLINAGDGGHQHPTQTLTDLLTISEIKGRLQNLTIGFCGDLKFGRTVHSLIRALSRHEGIRFVLISPGELRVPYYVKEEILQKGDTYTQVERLEEVIGTLDILYMTRVQKERFFSEEEYVRLKDSYILDKTKMDMAKEDMIVMHPLPRVNEISVEVDQDKRAVYFQQALYGKYIRMALILRLLGVK